MEPISCCLIIMVVGIFIVYLKTLEEEHIDEKYTQKDEEE